MTAVRRPPGGPRQPLARLATSPETTSATGYPWVTGDLLYADDLNAAIAGAGGGGGVAEAPIDGKTYGRLSAGWNQVLPLSGGVMGGPLSLATNPANADSSTAVASTAFVKGQRLDQFVPPTADVSMNAHKITALAAPTATSDAATKSYVDGLAQGLSVKAASRLATTTNVPVLSGLLTIDGTVTVAGDRVLVKDQTTQTENGIYVAASGTWVRAADTDIWLELVAAYTLIQQGVVNASNGYYCTVAAGGAIGTTPITWVQFSSAGASLPEAPATGTVYGRQGSTASWQDVLVPSELPTTGIVATGSTASRNLAARFAEVVNVKDFGAVGDGITDDAAAINAAMAYLRTLTSPGIPGISNPGPACKFVIPPGRYLVTATLNWTALASVALHIEAGGAVILGRTSGTPVVDCLGSRWLHIHGLTIQGDTTNQPNKGLQIGRWHGQSADLHHINTVTVGGEFTFCALYNMGAENVTYTHLNCWNRYNPGGTTPATNVAVVVLDGIDYWDAQSAFLPPNTHTIQMYSMNHNIFVDCLIMSNLSGGPAVWIAGAAGCTFIGGYLANTATGLTGVVPGMIIYASQALPVAQLHADIHFEIFNTLTDCFLIDGPPATARADIQGLYFKDAAMSATHSVFRVTSNVASVNMHQCDINIWQVVNSGAVVFDNPSIWSVTGRYNETLGQHWNNPPGFLGVLDLSGGVVTMSSTTVSIGTGGAATITSDGAGGVIHSGAVKIGTGAQNIMTMAPGTAAGNQILLTQSGTGGFALGGANLANVGNLTTNGINAFNNGQVIVGSGAGTVSEVQLVAAATNPRVLQWFTGGIAGPDLRWQIGPDAAPEGGGTNAGCNFNIYAHSDTGGGLGIPFAIVRQTQQTWIAALKVTGNVGFYNTAPIAQPTGWGTSTGGARGPVTASSTLPQVATALAQLLADLKAYGLVGT